MKTNLPTSNLASLTKKIIETMLVKQNKHQKPS